NRGGAFLRWASEAVMPFYMLHQTVILVVGYYVLQTASTPAAKYAAIWLLSLPIVLALYEFAIRRVAILRALFGLRAVPSPEALPAASPAPAAWGPASPILEAATHLGYTEASPDMVRGSAGGVTGSRGREWHGSVRQHR
ncbi:MAG: hypothetical protein ACYC5O_17955, partial [Anaerolineae bacterium]